jgi:hypothetical protein
MTAPAIVPSTIPTMAPAVRGGCDSSLTGKFSFAGKSLFIVKFDTSFNVIISVVFPFGFIFIASVYIGVAAP